MKGSTLMEAMSYPGYGPPLPLSRYNALAEPCEIALKQAGCNTVERISMFLAQIGAESGSLRWTQELASGEAYDRYLNPRGPWRALGNTEAGDGVRFKGRSLIQITGRYHYTELSKWAHKLGYCPTSTHFVDHPAQLASDKYAFLGPVYYWTVARKMNKYADVRDIKGGTLAVNGAYNNLVGRTARWKKCLSLGSALLSGPAPTPVPEEEDDMATVLLVNKKDAAKKKVTWPGYFLLVGKTLTHISTTPLLHTYQHLYPQKTISVAEYRALGGK